MGHKSLGQFHSFKIASTKLTMGWGKRHGRSFGFGGGAKTKRQKREERAARHVHQVKARTELKQKRSFIGRVAGVFSRKGIQR